MITVSYNAYCAITKEGDNDIWAVRPQGVVLLLPLCSQIDVGATVNALLGDTFSRENNTHGSRFHDRDPQFASRILGAMTQSCYIGTRDIRSRVIRGLYCSSSNFIAHRIQQCNVVCMTNMTNSRVIIDIVMWFCWWPSKKPWAYQAGSCNLNIFIPENVFENVIYKNGVHLVSALMC